MNPSSRFAGKYGRNTRTRPEHQYRQRKRTQSVSAEPIKKTNHDQSRHPSTPSQRRHPHDPGGRPAPFPAPSALLPHRGAGRELEPRGLRPGEVCGQVPRGRRPVIRGTHPRLGSPRPVDGLGQRLLHLQRHEHRVHLAVPEARPRAGLAVSRSPLDRVVSALRHLDLAARALTGGRLP